MRNRHLLLLPALAFASLAFSAAPALAETNYGVTGSFGSATSSPADPQPLSEPTGVAISEVGATKGDVYVVDKGNKRVEFFSSTGAYIGQFNGSGLFTGEEGKKAPNPLLSPEFIAVNNDPSSPSVGDVYVTDTGHNVIEKFSSTGAYEAQLTGTCQHENESAVEPGACPGSTSKEVIRFKWELRGVAVDSAGNLWAYEGADSNKVGDEASAAVDEFNDIGSFVKTFATPNIAENSTNPCCGRRLGVAIDSHDDVYVSSDRFPHEITLKYSAAGELLEAGAELYGGAGGIALAIDPLTDNLFIDQRNSIEEFGPFGEPLSTPIATFPTKGLSGSEGVAVSAAGTIYATQQSAGDVDILTEGATPTTPITGEPKEITATSATLHGELRGGETEYYFEYNNNGGCTGGVKTPVQAATGSLVKEVSAKITGLEPSESYSVCLVSENAFGPSSGLAEPFTTFGAPPEILAGSESASNIEPEAGVFTAEINPNNQETTYSFEYSTEVSANGEELEGSVKTVEGAPLPAGLSGEQPVRVEAHEGKPAATYYYRVVATNATGKATPGKVESYTKLPVVGGGSVSELASSTTTLEATLYPDFQTTTYVWEYATEAALLGTPSAKKAAPHFNFIYGNEQPEPPTPLSEPISGLQPETVYYYRVVATNETTENASNANKGLPVDGEIHHFRTLAVPLVNTGEAQAITRTTATLSGTVNPEGAQTTYYFAYIDQTGYEKALAGDAAEKANPYAEGETTAPISAGSGILAEAVGPIPAGGMLPGTTYDYALVAKNEIGVKIGPNETLTTQSGTPPIVSTGGASGVSQNTATISGTVGTNSLQTSYGFEISTEPGNYGPATGLGSIGGATTEAVTLTLAELQPGTTYYYRVTATNADGTVQGAPATFTTPGFPTLLVAPTSLPQIANPAIAFPAGSQSNTGTTSTPKALTNAQKLKKALKSCKKDKKHSKRMACEKAAHKHYGPVKKAKKVKK